MFNIESNHDGRQAMTSTRPDLSPQTAQENYHRLAATEQAVLQFLAILLEPTNRINLARYLRSSGVLGDDGKPLTAITLPPIIEQLTALNLVASETSTSSFFHCSESIAFHAIQAAVVAGRFRKMVSVIQKELPLFTYSFMKKIISFERCLRELRIAIFSRDPDHAAICLQACREQFPDEMIIEPPFTTICASPFDGAWFRELPPAIQADALDEIVPHYLAHFESVAEILPLLQELRRHSDVSHAMRFRKQLVTILIFQGALAEAQSVLDGDEPVADALLLQGWLLFLRGENEKAIQVFDMAIKMARKVADKRRIVHSGVGGVFFLLALLKSGDPGRHAQLDEFLVMARNKPSTPNITIMSCFEALRLLQNNKTSIAIPLLEKGFMLHELAEGMFKLVRPKHKSRWTELFRAVTRYWIDVEQALKRSRGLPALCDLAMRHGHRWAAMEAAALIAALDPQATVQAEYAAAVQRETGMQSILPMLTREEAWERSLKALIHMGATDVDKVGAKSGGASRLVWMIGMVGNAVHLIMPREQTCSARGTWSKGRPVALKRLYQNTGNLDFLTEQDRRICAAISRDNNFSGGTVYQFVWSQAMLAMVGHPLVFWEGAPQTNVEVVKAEPELLVEQQGNQVSVRFAGSVAGEGVIASKETPTRCKLVEITTAHQKIAEILGNKGLRVPVKAKEQVMQAMQAVASLVTIHSGIGGGMANVQEIPADATPHLHLLPHGDGLKVSLMVRPFSGDGPYFHPGRGGKTIIAEVNGQRVQTHRNVQEEIARANTMLSACATLGVEEGQTEWVLEEPESCLELLLELQTVADPVVVAWPEGEKMRVGHPVAMDDLRVRIQRDQGWFAVTGELQVDESLVMGLGELLDLMRGKESRFIPLGEGRFLALTEAFRKRLVEINDFSEKKGPGQRFHPLAGPVFRDLLEDAGAVATDQHWKAHLKGMDRAQGIDPLLPSTLRAELRDYQVTGFRWLARLAAWGVGGCLADDMGLGKTVQALALLLYRAQDGPSLVVAPTSVGLNWLAEIERFAPTLNGIVFGGGQRQQTLDALNPFDVVICSYGLLPQETDMLGAVRWNVIVLDEAQAIKNRLTKRSQAAMTLTGSFRVITTGTPVENHLGELWNLFQFLNPGLLGSLEGFNERFAAPIERYGDKGAQKRLRKLIQPFLLRRTKSQVLEELPPRTEIVLNVEMSPEEMAFYETLRRQAIDQIENFQGPMEQNRFQILAEIMRLRRACCNSRLVLPNSPIASSKLALFWEVVEELLENRHKVLVFSQFVDHLAIIRALLDEKKVAYQYLDGSTPARERQRRVQAFQAGAGDLFLISLRAGGVGINLTAADYVIHMDPWWNPAVEDQASDRAHRIGQMRPVTIYRLVTKGTIEAKIVELHRHKRDLADGLLEGGEMSGKLSLDALLDMIRGRE